MIRSDDKKCDKRVECGDIKDDASASDNIKDGDSVIDDSARSDTDRSGDGLTRNDYSPLDKKEIIEIEEQEIIKEMRGLKIQNVIVDEIEIGNPSLEDFSANNMVLEYNSTILGQSSMLTDTNELFVIKKGGGERKDNALVNGKDNAPVNGKGNETANAKGKSNETANANGKGNETASRRDKRSGDNEAANETVKEIIRFTDIQHFTGSEAENITDSEAGSITGSEAENTSHPNAPNDKENIYMDFIFNLFQTINDRLKYLINKQNEYEKKSGDEKKNEESVHLRIEILFQNVKADLKRIKEYDLKRLKEYDLKRLKEYVREIQRRYNSNQDSNKALMKEGKKLQDMLASQAKDHRHEIETLVNERMVIKDKLCRILRAAGNDNENRNDDNENRNDEKEGNDENNNRNDGNGVNYENGVNDYLNPSLAIKGNEGLEDDVIESIRLLIKNLNKKIKRMGEMNWNLKTENAKFKEKESSFDVLGLKKELKRSKEYEKVLKSENLCFSQAIQKLSEKNIKMKQELVQSNREIKRIEEALKMKESTIERQKSLILMLQNKVMHRFDFPIDDLQKKIEGVQGRIEKENDFFKRQRLVNEKEDLERRLRDFLNLNPRN